MPCELLLSTGVLRFAKRIQIWQIDFVDQIRLKGFPSGLTEGKKKGNKRSPEDLTIAAYELIKP